MTVAKLEELCFEKLFTQYSNVWICGLVQNVECPKYSTTCISTI